MRTLLRPLSILLVAIAAAVLAAPAAAKTERDSDGQVSAAFSYTKASDVLLYKNVKVEITRGGALLLSRPIKGFGPGGFEHTKTVNVMDLDGDGEPEVVLNLFSGGAHCCTTAYVYRYRAADNSYVRSDRFFGDYGFDLRNLDGKGGFEFLGADPAFSGAFTSYVETVFPIQVLRFKAGRFSRATSAFPSLVRADLARAKRIYRKYRRDKEFNARGAFAAIAADQYTLGARSAAAATLRGAKARYGSSFSAALTRFLKRHGYTG